MKPAEMFEAVLNGTVSKEEFELWLEDREFTAYCKGSAEADYQHAMNS